jgi:choloylglycine hydrolase
MGSLGLPGDLSSASRFVRAAFTTLNSVSEDTEEESVSQFFHILNSVYQQKGCVKMDKGIYEKTVYSSCCNTDKGIYYYKTYDNSQFSAVNLQHEDLDNKDLIIYNLINEQQFYFHN